MSRPGPPSESSGARAILDRLLALVEGLPYSDIAERLADVPAEDLLRVRRLIDHALASSPHTDHPPIKLASPENGGVPFRQELQRRTGDAAQAQRLLGFIDEWGVLTGAAEGAEPTIEHFVRETGMSAATVSRRISAFREAFPAERTPLRVSRVLRSAPYDLALWSGDQHRAVWHELGDVPVVAQDRRPWGWVRQEDP